MLDKLLGFSLTPALIMSFVPACLALLAAVTEAKRLAFALFMLTLFMAGYFNYIEPLGVLVCISLTVSAAGFTYSKQPYIRQLSACLVFILAVLMLLHLAPGFNNPQIIGGIQISDGAVSFTKYLNADKIIVAIILLLFIVPAPQPVSCRQFLPILIIFTLVTALSLTLALAAGLVVVDAKIPLITGGWLLSNLLFTCFAEEAFFRGFIQHQLQGFTQHRCWPVVVVMLSGVLFGLAHFPAGVIYMLIATLTGWVYAYSYLKTKNILFPITLHFGFNCVHFFFFTYPYFANPQGF